MNRGVIWVSQNFPKDNGGTKIKEYKGCLPQINSSSPNSCSQRSSFEETSRTAVHYDCCEVSLQVSIMLGCFPRIFHANSAALWSCFKNFSSAPLRVSPWQLFCWLLSKSLTATDRPWKWKARPAGHGCHRLAFFKEKNEGEEHIRVHFATICDFILMEFWNSREDAHP